MESAPDRVVVECAIARAEMIVTCDLDYPEIIALAHAPSPSLIVFRLHDETPENINRLLDRFLPELQESLVQGAIVTVEEDRVRVRPLPIG